MKHITFSWDPNKNKLNQKKHGVSFEEAKTVFYDENAVQFEDTEHSTEEDRFYMLGFSARLRILIVCHCFRKDDSEIRIISARQATKTESEEYGGAMR